MAELEQIQAIAAKYPQLKFKLGIRINIEMDDFFSRFGFDPRTDAFKYAIHVIRSVPNLQLVGLHTHSSRIDRSPNTYQSKLRYLIQLASRVFEKEELEYLNIGGGFWSKLDDNMRRQLQVEHLPTFDEYGHAVASLMKREFPDEDVELIMEPGLSVTANILDYVVKVIDIRVISGRNIATTTGSHQCVKPTGHKKALTVEIHREKENVWMDVVCDVVGYTCLEFDVLYHALRAPLQVGNYIQFRNVGGYTLVLKPPFIKLSPAILNVEGEQEVVVKAEERFEDAFRSYKF